jgi:hypothetical protein
MFKHPLKILKGYLTETFSQKICWAVIHASLQYKCSCSAVASNITGTTEKLFPVVTHEMSSTSGKKYDFEGKLGFMNLILYSEISSDSLAVVCACSMIVT